MTALVRAESRKLTTTRLWLWMLIHGPGHHRCHDDAAIGFAEPGPLGLDTTASQRTIFAQAAAALMVVGILGRTTTGAHRGSSSKRRQTGAVASGLGRFGPSATVHWARKQ